VLSFTNTAILTLVNINLSISLENRTFIKLEPGDIYYIYMYITDKNILVILFPDPTSNGGGYHRDVFIKRFTNGAIW